MISKHIHIKGLVQGVGFRPHVFRLANHYGLKGYVNNSSDGVHIVVTASENTINNFLHELLAHPPANAIITHHFFHEIPFEPFQHFAIAESHASARPDLLLTPDLGLCDECRKELMDEKNRRYHYAFITCIHCGPRYSITNELPYDRCNTTMDSFEQCRPCNNEFHNPRTRRYYSQTNSCEECGITMQLLMPDGSVIANENEIIFQQVNNAFAEGKIVAVKGIGGYLLMCDATNEQAIATLRQRKHRPSKPLALLYPSLLMLEEDVLLCDEEKAMLQNIKAPIVLCTLQENLKHPLPLHLLAPGLNRIGAMLPYAPLLALLADAFGKPLVATSGNISGCPIIFNDVEAMQELGKVADLVLTHNREIVTPQDDSVVQFSTEHKQFIILRRSRGWAPGYYPFNLKADGENLLAMGAEMKSSFGIVQQGKCYISQYLGDHAVYEASQSFNHTLHHLTGLLHFEPDVILADRHPGYESTKHAEELAAVKALPLVKVQHHEAHFAAVLAENDLLPGDENILGVVWDGTGYGNDGQIWGGEFFSYCNSQFKRIAHLNYFPVLMGDKMSREPRLSALSLCRSIPLASDVLQQKFSEAEWKYFNEQLQFEKQNIQTSSMGRMLDGIASLLGIIDKASYEGEAAMLLQATAENCDLQSARSYEFEVVGDIVEWQPVIASIVADRLNNISVTAIAAGVHMALAKLVDTMASITNYIQVAFSGGVMQNALLVDLFYKQLQPLRKLYFHKQLSPNDECISFGQIAWYIDQDSAASVEDYNMKSDVQEKSTEPIIIH